MKPRQAHAQLAVAGLAKPDVPILVVRFGGIMQITRIRDCGDDCCGNPIYCRTHARDASGQLEGAVDVKASRITLLIIIAATVICVAGVLILPQVDLPDFVLNGSKAPAITTVHGKPTSSSNGFSHLDILNPILGASRLYKSGSTIGDVGAFVGPDTLLSLRC